MERFAVAKWRLFSGISVWSRDVVHNQSHIEENKIDAFDQWCLRRILSITWSEHVTNYEVRRRSNVPTTSQVHGVQTNKILFAPLAALFCTPKHCHCYQTLCGPSSRLATWPGLTSLKIIPVLYKPAYLPLQGTGGGVQVVQDISGWGRWRKICTNSILDSRQGFEGHKTEQLGGHSLEQQRHRQAPTDWKDVWWSLKDISNSKVPCDLYQCSKHVAMGTGAAVPKLPSCPQQIYVTNFVDLIC